jgi:poly-gamma-glutamate synthesis protein (capsule biosynthesis protein)
MRPGMSQLADEGLQAALKIIRDADVAIGNFEGSISDIRRFEGPYRYFMGPKEIAGDLKAMGFDLLARANNHIFDGEAEGMFATNDLLEQAGIVIAGAGKNLQDARAATFLETPKGRIALISMHTPTDTAGLLTATDLVGNAGGRPGLNALNTTSWVAVTSDQIVALRKVRDAIYEHRTEYTNPVPAPSPTEPADQLRLFGTNYVVGSRPGALQYTMNENDLRGILRSIRNGKQYSDFLVATIHAHQAASALQQSLYGDEPPDFLIELARKSIDAGADAFVGHGPHRLRGIEIYKDKPIFYGLGEFFSQMHWAVPDGRNYLARDANPLTTDLTDADLNANLSPVTWPALNYESYVAVSRFDDGRLIEVRLHPVELRYREPLSKVGIPRIAPPDTAHRILTEVQRLSKPLGTTVVIEGNVGVIRIAASTTSTAGTRR